MQHFNEVNEKSTINTHLEELDDPQRFTEVGIKLISQQDYFSCLNELKEEIRRAWHGDDRVTSLKLSIKVGRLLMDTSVEQFYPKLFLLATDIFDMLGEFVWERIRQKAEYAENGSSIFSFPDNFKASDISSEAKETCGNWFSKIGAIRELLPRIYLELAILPCCRFVHDYPTDILQRLVMMTRGIGNPLASAYCRLYIVHRAQRVPQCGIGYLVTCINDLKILLYNIASTKEDRFSNFSGNRRLLLSLIEPTIEYTMKTVLKDSDQTRISEILVGLGLGKKQGDLFGQCACISIVLYHLLKELPIEVICSNAVGIFNLIEYNNDPSFDQCLNYQLLGFRLCERISQVYQFQEVANKVIQVVTCYSRLDEYLNIIDAYLDIIMKMDGYMKVILDGIFEHTSSKEVGDSELTSLQSIILKLLTYFDNIKDMLALEHFVDIIGAMRGSSRTTISLQILRMASRTPFLQDTTIIQFIYEVCQAIHDGMDISNSRSEEYQQATHLVSRFVNMVDYGPKVEQHLTFLVECRGSLGGFSELREPLVHLSNRLAINVMKNGNTISLVKSCLAFSEVTIPSVPVHIRQLNLYLETAEVALLGGLVSHFDGLVDSAVRCLENLSGFDGLQKSNDLAMITSLLCKLCSLMVLAPGKEDQGVTYLARRILSFLTSESGVFPKMKIRVLCALVSSLAASCQNLPPYHAIQGEVVAYLQNALSLSDVIVQNMQAAILQEPSQAVRGQLALEACKCIASSFSASRETSAICSSLMETAKSSLSVDDKYLTSTLKFLGKYQDVLRVQGEQTHEL
ncbi:hypothetical protein Leryth_005727 [Lithospermum erythrorhizon]|nr:hypothetical protein Leryth_005727 [Lithospermum erythrorhizon]